MKWTTQRRFGTGLVIALVLISYLVFEYRAYPSRQMVPVCQANLRSIFAAVQSYRTESGNFPDTLQRCVERGILTSLCIRCPCNTNYQEGDCSYDYFNPDGGGDSPDALLIADKKPVHPRGTYHAITRVGKIKTLTEKEYRAAITIPSAN